jgi:hypothetical protein
MDMKKNSLKLKKSYSKPELIKLGTAKELIKSEFSEIFDQKNSSAQVDFFNANVS